MEQFNARQFFAAHESWEEIWLTAEEPDKTFLQGIIQVAAAFHHYQRQNRAGAQSLLRQGLSKLESFSEDYRGIRLEELRNGAAWWEKELAEGRSPTDSGLPKIDKTEKIG
jgi:predicted metal-dependent hydrolase